MRTKGTPCYISFSHALRWVPKFPEFSPEKFRNSGKENFFWNFGNEKSPEILEIRNSVIVITIYTLAKTSLSLEQCGFQALTQYSKCGLTKACQFVTVSGRLGNNCHDNDECRGDGATNEQFGLGCIHNMHIHNAIVTGSLMWPKLLSYILYIANSNSGSVAIPFTILICYPVKYEPQLLIYRHLLEYFTGWPYENNY